MNNYIENQATNQNFELHLGNVEKIPAQGDSFSLCLLPDRVAKYV